MRKIATIAVFTTLLIASAVGAADVRLLLDESKVLPGTPTGFTVVVSNPDAAPLQLPAALWLVATDDDVTTFLVSAYNASDNAAIAIPAEQRTVPAGGTREFRLDPSPVLAASPWFTDGRLSSPGRYHLRAVFAPEVLPNGEFNAAHALASKDELLTIAVDSPEDAAVWDWMQSQGRGQWGQNEWMTKPFADFVLSKHPTSAYALYAAVFAPRDKDGQNPAIAAQVARFPGKSYSDQLRLIMVQHHQQAADILRRSDLPAAAEHAEAARRIASELTGRSRSANVRAQAERHLAETPTRAQLMNQPRAR